MLSVCIVCLTSSYFLYSTVSPPIVKFICSTVDTLFHNCDWSLLVTGSLEGQENKRTRRQSCVSQQSWDDCTFPSYFHPALTTLLCILYITVSLCSLSGCWFVPFSCVFCFLVLCYLFMSVFVLIFEWMCPNFLSACKIAISIWNVHTGQFSSHHSLCVSGSKSSSICHQPAAMLQFH